MALNGALLGWTSTWPLWLLPLPLLLVRAAAGSRLRAALRAATLMLVLLALAAPVLRLDTGAVSVLYLVDTGADIEPAFLQALPAWIRRANAAGQPRSAQLLPFAATPGSLQAAQEAIVPAPQASAPEAGGSDLEAALLRAADAFAPDEIKRVVLLGEGRPGAGRWWRSLPRLRERGVRVYAYPAPVRLPASPWVEVLDAAGPARRDEPLDVRVQVQAAAPAAVEVRLQVDAAVPLVQPVRLQAGSCVVAFRVVPRHAGTMTLRAQVVPAAAVPAAGTVERTLAVAHRPRVLLVPGAQESAAHLRRALETQGLDVAEARPGALPDLDGEDAVLLAGVAPAELPEAARAALERHVREDGAGLVYVAGPAAHGRDGYAGSALERALPVRFQARDRERELALVVCLDRSYSMKGRKIELARAATLAALGSLEDTQRFGVVAFDSRAHEVVPLRPAAARAQAAELVRRIQAGGQTNLFPALQQALQMLAASPARNRHVILLSDGDTAPADFEGLLGRMTAARITVSTVALGADADRTLMRQLAQWGLGRAYVAEDAAQVPGFFLEDTRDAGRSTLVEVPVRPRLRHPDPLLEGVDLATAPLLRGYAALRARPQADVLLETAGGDPLLARWQHGLGRTLVFAGDAGRRWSADWVGWSGYGRFWAQLVREALRRDDGEGMQLAGSRSGTGVRLQLDVAAVDGGWATGLQPRARLTGPAGAVLDLPLQALAPGHYEGTVQPAWPAGRAPWRVQLLPGGGVGGGAAQAAGSLYLASAVHGPRPADASVLRALSEATGGAYAAPVAQVFAVGADRAGWQLPLTRVLLALALVAFLAELALRRLGGRRPPAP